MSFLTERVGRRRGFTFGLVTGVLGAGLATIAIVIGEFSLYLAGSLLMGVTTSATSVQALQFLQGAAALCLAQDVPLSPFDYTLFRSVPSTILCSAQGAYI